jgi:hypothetical protein
MKRMLLAAILAAFALPATAQTTTVGVGAAARSDSESTSVSGSAARSNQGQTQSTLSNAQQAQDASNTNTVAPSQSVTINGTPIPTNTTSNVNYSGTTTQKAAPAVIAPNLAQSINNDLCIVSASIGGSGIGFGFGVGLQYTDVDCVRRINARQLFNMGYAKAAVALMAQDESIKKALADAGFSPLGEPLPKQPEKLVEIMRIDPHALLTPVTR